MMDKASKADAEVKTADTESVTAAEKEVQAGKVKRKYNKWDLKYLKFIDTFILQAGMKYYEAAEKGGISRQTIHHWFENDDAKISSIIKFVNNCGYNINFSIRPKSNFAGDAFVTINSKQALPSSSDKNLSFLDDAFKFYSLKKKPTAERLGLKYIAIFYWFQHDDVFISYVYRIAEMYDLKLVIQIDPK